MSRYSTNARKPLSVTVKHGVLTIEIGVATLAHACLCSEYASRLVDPEFGCAGPEKVKERFSIPAPTGFARDVRSELCREAEDGSSLLTNLIDTACREAIEMGSLHFADKLDPP